MSRAKKVVENGRRKWPENRTKIAITPERLRGLDRFFLHRIARVARRIRSYRHVSWWSCGRE